MRRTTLAACAAAALVTGGAAQERPAHLTAYKAYTEAREANDAEAARAHAEAAWRAGEAELGTHETTAILAQNYLLEVIWADPEAAREAAARALALGREGLGLTNLTLAELEVADAYAAAAADPKDRDARGRLYAALAAEGESGAASMDLAVRAARQGAYIASDAGEHEAAYAIATRAARRLEGAEGIPVNVVGVAQLQRIAAMLSEDGRWRPEGEAGKGPSLRWERRVRDAHVLADATVGLFPPQDGLDAIDPILALAYAWRGIIGSIEHAYDIRGPEGWTFDGRGAASEGTGPLVARTGADGEPLACQVEWTSRDMTYPAAARRKGYLGGVLLGYHLTDEGAVRDARVLAEVPAERFGETVLEQVEDWRAVTEGVDPACLRDLTVSVNFTIR